MHSVKGFSAEGHGSKAIDAVLLQSNFFCYMNMLKAIVCCSYV